MAKTLNLLTHQSDLEALGAMHYFFDSAFPSGSYAHSFGFETFAVGAKAGDKDAAIAWIENYLIHSLWHGDLENIERITELAEYRSPQSLEAVEESDALTHIARSTREGRRSARQLARSLNLAAVALFGELFADQAKTSFLEPSTIVGLLALHLGWPLPATRLYYLQSQALGATSVLVRHGRIGQFRQLEMMGTLRATALSLARSRPQTSTSPTGAQCWQLEFDQIAHQHLSPRLFQS